MEEKNTREVDNLANRSEIFSRKQNTTGVPREQNESKKEEGS